MKNGFFSRLQNILLVALIAGWQVVFASAPFLSTAHAATIPSNKLDVTSSGFVLGSAYSVVAGKPTGTGQYKNGNVSSYPEGACIPAVFDVTNKDSTAGDALVTPVFDYFNSVVGVQDYELATSSGNAETGVTNLNQLTYGGSGSFVGAMSFPIISGGSGSVSATVSPAYGGNDTTTTATTSTDAFRHHNVQLTNIPAGATVQIQICGRLGQDASQYNGGSSLSFRTVQGGQENVPIPVNQILVLPSITITKTISAGSSLPSDFSFDISPAVNGVSHYTIPSGQTSVTINNVNPDGTYAITESGPNGYTFTGGSGTGCSAVQASIGTASGQMSATVAAGKPATNATCNFTNSVQKGSITIVKDAQPNSPQDFAFTTTGSGLSNFSLDDDSDPTLSNTKIFSNLLPGQYSVSETSLSGWDFDNINCSQGATVQTSGTTASITLAAGQNVTCTYVNKQRGHVIVHKVTQPANDPTSFSVTASSSTGGNIAGNATQNITTSADVTYDVSQGTYAVSEAAQSGWTQASNTCSNLVISANTPLVNGVPTLTCTITNTKLAHLKIVKATNPSPSTQAFTFGASGPSITQGNNAFTLDTDGSSNTYPDNYQYVDLAPGSYSVNETMPSNWTMTGLTCTGTNSYSNPSSTNLSVTLAAGDDVICTYTNTEYASISGSKLEVNADSSVVQTLSGWTINLLMNGSIVGTTTTNGSGVFSFNNLMSGNYTLVEVSPSGWTQIYAPSGINLTAGQMSTDNNFGNFQNATISGSKFNDVNGNGSWDQGELGLQGWVVTLYDNGGSGALLNHQVAQTSTAADGSYSFTNLPPTNYQVCETAQSGWTQTYPSQNSGCNLVTIALSGHNYSGNNFGNQGRGTITVVKNVDDGFGNVTSDVTDWTWGYSGTNGSGSDISTGSSNSQNVAAGSYTVSENQKTNYHVTASSCSGEESTAVNTSKSVTVSAGENVVCTFTNTRDTGTITVIKNLRPDDDSGLFNLRVDGTSKATNVGDAGTTGQVKVVTGNHNVDETAGTSTVLSDYTSSYSCVDGNTAVASGSGTSSSDFNVSKDSNIVCTFTNTKLGQVTGSKFNDINGNHTWDQNEPGLQGWTIDLHQCAAPQVGLDLKLTPVQDCSNIIASTVTAQDGSYTFTNLENGNYKVCEEMQANWQQTYPQTADGCTYFTINLSENPAQSVLANFGNQGRGTITVVKNVDDGFGNVTTDVTDWTWNINGIGQFSTGSDNHLDVAAGSYNVNEVQKTDYHVTASSCTGEANGDVSTSKSVTVSPGENVVCTFTNTRDTGTITVIKDLKPSTDSGLFNLRVDGTTQAANVGDAGTTGQVKVVTGNHNVDETAGTNTSLDSYNSWYSCSDEQWGYGTSVEDINVSKDQNITCTFHNVRLGTLTGVKFNDLNANGIKDQGEPNLSDWTINLYDCQQPEVFSLTNLDQIGNGQVCGGDPIATTQTDENGTYEFDNLNNGDYKVCEVQQARWTQTAPDNTGCQDFSINLDTEEGQPGQIVTKDFGNFKNGSISGFKFSDPNGNGTFDNGEAKLSGWTIELSLSDGNGGWTDVSSAVTDSSGNYIFTNLTPGEYQVCEVPQAGWIRIFPVGSDCQTVGMNQSGTDIQALFANQKKTVPQVLAAVTPTLVNTGQPILVSVIVGSLIITSLLTVTYFTAKKQN